MSSGSASGSPHSCLCLENLQKRGKPRRPPYQMPEPPQLAVFDVKEQRLDSKLLKGSFMLPLRLKIEKLVSNYTAVTAQILLCILHIGMDVKLYNH